MPEPVGIFVATALPRRVRVAEVDINSGFNGEFRVLRHFSAIAGLNSAGSRLPHPLCRVRRIEEDRSEHQSAREWRLHKFVVGVEFVIGAKRVAPVW
jgi:hypothetical protein